MTNAIKLSSDHVYGIYIYYNDVKLCAVYCFLSFVISFSDLSIIMYIILLYYISIYC